MSVKVVLGKNKGYVFILPEKLKKRGDVYCLPESLCIDEISYNLLQRPDKAFGAILKDESKNLYALYPLTKSEEVMYKYFDILKDPHIKEAHTDEGASAEFTAFPTERIGIKQIKDSRNDENTIPNYVLKEIAIYRLLSDFTCIPYLYNFQLEPKIKLQIELGIESLASALPISEKDCKTIIHRLCRCMQIIASQGIIHGDLKPGNVIITELGQVQIIDWGGSSIDRTGNQGVLKNIAGTFGYFAPEVLLNYKRREFGNYTYKIDIFSLGMILYVLLTGHHMFGSFHPTMDENIEGLLKLADIGYTEVDVIIEKGTSIADKLKEKLITEYKLDDTPADLLSRMLEYSPKRRCTYEEILIHPYFTDIRTYIPDFPQLICNPPIPLHYNVGRKIPLPIREKVLDWIVDICNSKKQPYEVYFTSLQLFDFFIYLRDNQTNISELQGIACVSMLISSKLLSVTEFTSEYLSYMSSSSVTEDFIIQYEKEMLQTLNGNLLVPTLWSFQHENYIEVRVGVLNQQKQLIDKMINLYKRSDVYDLLRDASKGGTKYKKLI